MHSVCRGIVDLCIGDKIILSRYCESTWAHGFESRHKREKLHRPQPQQSELLACVWPSSALDLVTQRDKHNSSAASISSLERVL